MGRVGLCGLACSIQANVLAFNRGEDARPNIFLYKIKSWPFLTVRILQEIFGRAGSKLFLGNICTVHVLKISDCLTAQEFFQISDSWFYMQRSS